jgi:hypothetical protein
MAAQCANVWLPGEGRPGTSGYVAATAMWDPDGGGPAPAKLVVGGDFAVAGTVVGNRIAAWDPATGSWSALGTPMGHRVRALTTLPNGDLIAVGEHHPTGGVVARWDGTAWSLLGSAGGIVSPVITQPNGDLVLGGNFTAVGGVAASRIARWDGTSWSALGTGVSGTVGNWVAITSTNALQLVAGDF